MEVRGTWSCLRTRLPRACHLLFESNASTCVHRDTLVGLWGRNYACQPACGARRRSFTRPSAPQRLQ